MAPVFQLSIDDLSALYADWEIGGIADPVGQIANYIISTLEGAFSAATSSFQTIVSSIVASAVAALSSTISSIYGNVNTIITSIQSLPSAISSSLNSIISQINSILSGVSSAISSSISQISYSISSSFNTVLYSLNSALNGLLTSITATIRSLASQIVAPIQTAINSIIGSLNSAIGQISTALQPTLNSISQSLNSVAAQITAGLNTAFQSLLTQLNSVIAGITAPITSAINSVLKTFFGSSEFKNLLAGAFGLPADIVSFFNSATTVLNQLTERHSPSILDNIGSFFSKFAEADWTTVFKILSGTLPLQIAWAGAAQTDFFKPLTDYATNLGGQILPALKTFTGNIEGGLLDLIDFALGGVMNMTGLTPSKDFAMAKVTDLNGKEHADPFQLIASGVIGKFLSIIPDVKSNSPITADQFTAVVEGGLAGLAVGEAAEYLGLGIDILHPMKNLQFEKKMKSLVHKLHLDHIPSLTISILMAQTFEPVLRRYFNKLAQLQLPDEGRLIEMNHRELLDDSTLDEYLQEYGRNGEMRSNMIELSHPLLGAQNYTDAYFRHVAYDGLDVKTATGELMHLFSMMGYSNEKRAKFTYSDQDLLQLGIYTLPNMRWIRILFQTGQFGLADFKKLLTAGRLRPDFIDPVANAMVLQGQLPYLKAQESAFMSQVSKGFETGATFTDMLKKIGYPDLFIVSTVAAAEIKADEELNVLQVSEFDKQYTEGYMSRADYVTAITPLFKNTDILKVHLDIADLAVQRTTDNRIRTASDRSISEELTAFANGAVSAAEFETICKAGNKTADEIKALESARQIIYKNLVRTVKFRNYQAALGKDNINVTQFRTLSLALPIDASIVDATTQHIVIAKVKAAKITAANANALLAQAGIPLITS